MNEALIQLIGILYNSQKPVSVRELSGKMGAASTTVKRLIQTASGLVPRSAAEICAKAGNGQGYYLVVYDEDHFKKWLSQLAQESISLSNKNDRELFLLFKILLLPSVRADEMVDDLHISRSQLTSDLKNVRAQLQLYDLKLESIPYKGLVLAGSEFNCRLCLCSALQRDVKVSGGTAHSTNDVIRPDVLSHAMDALHSVLSDEKYQVSDSGFNSILLHLLATILRRQAGFSFQDGSVVTDDIHDIEYISELSAALLADIGGYAGIPFETADVLYIAIHLAANRYLSRSKNIFVSQEISDLVSDILEHIKAGYFIDFSDDLDLIVSLGLHFVPLMTRIKYGLSVVNPLLNDVKKKYMQEFDLALYAASIIERNFNCKLSEDEISYIALYFALSLDRDKSISKKNVLLVCQSGSVTSAILKQSLENRFLKYLNQIDVCTVRDIPSKKLSNYDYIFSTVQIFSDTPIPVINIRHFLMESEYQHIENIIKAQFDFDQYFDERLFVPELKGATSQDIIRELAEVAGRFYDVPPSFADDILLRESISSTDLGYKTALPHPIKTFGDRTFVCVGIAPKPVLWNSTRVSVVLLTVTEENAPESIKFFHQKLLGFVDNVDAVEALIKYPTFDALRKIISGINQ